MLEIGRYFKSLSVILIILFFVGCTITGQLWDYYFDFPYADEIQTVYDCYLWVFVNTTYQEDIDDEWKTPEETYNDGGGDCEDLAILMMYLCYQYAGQTPTMLEIDLKGTRHMIVEVDGKLYDIKGPVSGDIQDLEYRILNSYTYGETMYMAVHK